MVDKNHVSNFLSEKMIKKRRRGREESLSLSSSKAITVVPYSAVLCSMYSTLCAYTDRTVRCQTKRNAILLYRIRTVCTLGPLMVKVLCTVGNKEGRCFLDCSQSVSLLPLQKEFLQCTGTYMLASHVPTSQSFMKM